MIKYMLLLALMLASAMAEDHSIFWSLGYFFPRVTIRPGDTLTFNWQGYHDVHLMKTNPEDNGCDLDNAVEIGLETPVVYTFTEDDAGKQLYFVCTVPGHCSAGQVLPIFVEGEGTETTWEPTPAPSSYPTRAPEPLPATVVDLAVASPELTTLVNLVTQAGLVDVLSGEGPYTVFAPNNAALEGIGKYENPEWHAHLTDILLYHVAAGEFLYDDLTVNLMMEMANLETAKVTSYFPRRIESASITSANKMADNGVLHVIDNLLLPFSATNSMVDVVQDTGDLAILAQLLSDANLIEALSGEGPFTLFAPSHSAFDKLDSDTLAYLTSPEGAEDLANILSYHVTAGIYLSSDIMDGAMIEMLNGDETTISVPMMDDTSMGMNMTNATLSNISDAEVAISRAGDSDYAMINDASILENDILVSNGVIHIIDTILLPPVSVDETPPQSNIDVDAGAAAEPAMAVTRFILVNSETEQDIKEMVWGETLSDIPDINLEKLNIRAEVSGEGIGSVRFRGESVKARTENMAPYSYAGDFDGDYYDAAFTPGVSYRLTAIPFSEADMQGTMGEGLTLRFTG